MRRNKQQNEFKEKQAKAERTNKAKSKPSLSENEALRAKPKRVIVPSTKENWTIGKALEIAKMTKCKCSKLHLASKQCAPNPGGVGKTFPLVPLKTVYPKGLHPLSSTDEWTLVEMTVDSGASETVGPEQMLGIIELQEILR